MRHFRHKQKVSSTALCAGFANFVDHKKNKSCYEENNANELKQ
jgi:hypothetical protein